VKLLDEIGSPATIANMGGRFFGGVVGGALPASVAAHWLADAACLFDFSPVSAYLEDLVLGWLLSLLGLPPSSGGAFVTGTQMADVTALAAARHTVLRKVGWDVESEGLFAAPPVTVIVGEEAHATMLKALAWFGGSIHPEHELYLWGVSTRWGGVFLTLRPSRTPAGFASNRYLEFSPQRDLTCTVTSVFRRLCGGKHTERGLAANTSRIERSVGH
jgi:hypothetical protein